MIECQGEKMLPWKQSIDQGKSRSERINNSLVSEKARLNVDVLLSLD